MQVWRTTSGRGCCSAFELLLFALLSSCTKGDKPIVLVELRDASKSDIVFDKAKVEQFAVTTIEKVPGFAFRHAKKDENGWQYVFFMDLLTERIADDGKNKHRAVGGRLELKEVGGQGWFEASILETVDEPASAPFEPLIQRAIAKAAEQIAVAMKLQTANDDEVLALLDAPEERTRAQAIAIAGKRKIAKAVPKLMQIVRDQKVSDDLVLKAVGALVSIGDQEASGAIIDAMKDRTVGDVLPLLFALGQLGGLEAEAYLFTVQSGHPDPYVRKSAADALKELELRREEKKKVKSAP